MRVAGSGVDAWAGGRVASLVAASQSSGRLVRKALACCPRSSSASTPDSTCCYQDSPGADWPLVRGWLRPVAATRSRFIGSSRA